MGKGGQTDEDVQMSPVRLFGVLGYTGNRPLVFPRSRSTVAKRRPVMHWRVIALNSFSAMPV
jgi:hypothetical protein